MFRYAVALTGSIATGKSSAAKILQQRGFSMIDADSIAHTILNEEHQSIAEMFGEALVHNGVVDRKALGKIVFGSITEREKLEALLHPLIYNRIVMYANELDIKEKPYLVDIPLFFESKRYAGIKKVLLVYTPKEIQLQRLMQRDNTTAKEAQQRINTQIDIEKKRENANYVIDNSGTLTQLEHECIRVSKLIEKDFE